MPAVLRARDGAAEFAPGPVRMLIDRGASVLARAWRYYRREGARALIRRTGLEVRLRRTSREVNRWLPPGVTERNPRAIHANIDTPASGAPEWSDVLNVTGWHAPRRVERIDLYVDGRLTNRVRPGLHRTMWATCSP